MDKIASEWEKELERMLIKLNVGPHYKGYGDMFKMMSVFSRNPAYLREFYLKEIYAAASLNSQHAERRIRHMISIINKDMFENCFGEGSSSRLNVKKIVALFAHKLFQKY